jgi:hypothetical protein
MTSFMTAVKKKMDDTTLNEKGGLGYKTGVSENPETEEFYVKLAEMYLFSRGISREKIQETISEIFEDINSTKSQEEVLKKIQDIVILCLNIRDIRGNYGKGERDITYWILVEILKFKEQLAYSLFKELPNFGSYLDYCKIYEILHEDNEKFLMDMMEKITVEQLLSDLNTVTDLNKKNEEEISNTERVLCSNLSLLAKWIPREGKKYDRATLFTAKISSLIAPKMGITDLLSRSQIDNNKNKQVLYKLYKFIRKKVISPIMEHLKVVETLMCSGNWSEIDFEKGVCGRTFLKLKNAFLNKGKTGGIREKTVNDPDRKQCALNCTAYLQGVKSGEKKVKASGVLYVHELVRKCRSNLKYKYQNYNQIPDDDDNKIYIQGAMKDIIDKLSEEGMNALKNLCFMTDVSGSMEGDPIDAAIGITIIAAALQDQLWKRTLTFHSTPTWVDLSDISNDYVAQMYRLLDAPWGGSTNFHCALDSVLSICKNNNITELPDMCVLTDMQWDSAISNNYTRGHNKILANFNTQMEIMKTKIETAGFKLPKIYVWNLRNVESYAAPVDSKFIIQVSGFSTNLLRHFLEKGEFPKNTENSTVLLVKDILELNEYEHLRQIVSDNLERKSEEFLFDSTNSIQENYLKTEKSENTNFSVEAWNATDDNLGQPFSKVDPSDNERLDKMEEQVGGLQESLTTILGMLGSLVGQKK